METPDSELTRLAKEKLLNSAPHLNRVQLFPSSSGFGKGSDHAPTRPVWHAVDIFSVFGGGGLTLVVFGTSHTLLRAGR